MNFIEYKYKDIGKIRSGKRLKKGYIVSDKKTNNRYIRVRDINNGIIDVNNVQYISDEAASYITRYKVSKNDIIISVVGTVGSVASIPNELDGAYLTENCNNLLVDEKICLKEYLKYFLLSKDGQAEILSHIVGTTQPKLPIYGIEAFNIKIPEKECQNKIIKILNTINNKISLNTQINNNLQEQAEIFFKEEFVENKNEELTWNTYKLEEIFYHISPGTNYQPKRIESGIPFLNVRNINNGYINYNDAKFITEEDYKKVHKTWIPEENDLLISRIGTLGLVAVIRNEDLPVAVHYNFLDLKTKTVPFQFAYFLLKSSYFQKKYKDKTKQSVQEYVTVDDIRNIEIEIPEDDKIFDKYIFFYNKILNIQRQNKKLEQIRDTLLPKLMNGEIDLDKIEI